MSSSQRKGGALTLFTMDQFTGYWSAAWVAAPAAFLCKHTRCDYRTGRERRLGRSMQTWYFPFLKRHGSGGAGRENPEKPPDLKQTAGSWRNVHPGGGGSGWGFGLRKYCERQAKADTCSLPLRARWRGPVSPQYCSLQNTGSVTMSKKNQ